MKMRWMVLCLMLCLALAAPALAEPTGEAQLYVVVDGEEVAQYPLGFAGERPSASELFDGLTALTGYNFSVESAIMPGNFAMFVTWAEDASFLPGGAAPVAVDTVDLSFADRDGVLRFMLDSALKTLHENLGVNDLYFGTIDEAGLFLEDISWVLDADAPYDGDFAAHYVEDLSAYGCARDVPAIIETPGDSPDAVAALDTVFEQVVPDLDPPSASGSWTVGHLGTSIADGLEGEWFEIGWSDGDVYTAYYRVIVAADGAIHLRDTDEGSYTQIR